MTALLVGLVAIAGVWVGTRLGLSFGDSWNFMEMVSPIVAAVIWFVRGLLRGGGGGVWVALWRGLITTVIVLGILAVPFSVASVWILDKAIAEHVKPETQSLVAGWIKTVRTGFFGLYLAVVVAGSYAWWRTKSHRYALSRITLLKDTLMVVHKLLADSNLPLNERCEKATQKCLDGVLRMLQMSQWSWATSMVLRFRPSWDSCRVALLVPLDDGRMKIAAVAYPGNVPKSALGVYQALQDHYRPALFNETGFAKVLADAQQQDSRTWQAGFLRGPARQQYVSSAGYISVKRKWLLNDDTTQDLYFDASPKQALTDRTITPDGGACSADLAWVNVLSYIGCPVETSPSGSVPVLFASKNRKRGFVREDLEPLLAVANLLCRIHMDGGLPWYQQTTPKAISTTPST